MYLRKKGNIGGGLNTLNPHSYASANTIILKCSDRIPFGMGLCYFLIKFHDYVPIPYVVNILYISRVYIFIDVTNLIYKGCTYTTILR